MMLKLVGRQCLIIGGGKVALRRTRGLVDAGAKVTVIAPQIDLALRDIPEVHLIERAFTDTDLQGKFMVVVATDHLQLNDHITELAKTCNVLINRADDPDAGDISIPAHAHCGPITVAVHTHRISALAAATIRDQLLEHMDPAWPALLTAMTPFRKRLQETVLDTQVRQSILKSMANDHAMTIIKEQGVLRYLNYCESLMLDVTLKAPAKQIEGQGNNDE
ncbi:MAG: bifunctional precorrin-2 dehydrogenase/sirohydrochlorin ferrochelatase [Phycisphaeraceae bacterium]|nr:bifunctional precorrin-2 dehydrogenase/sirohydrochlorin ferrochelatase [Phycisphaeraceae bacterium]